MPLSELAHLDRAKTAECLAGALAHDPFCTSKSHGLGLGLAISQSIIETHGGRLWLASAEDSNNQLSPRPGTTFAFTLPVAS